MKALAAHPYPRLPLNALPGILSGGSILDQNEARRAEKNFFEAAPPPYLRVWMTAPPLPLYLKV